MLTALPNEGFAGEVPDFPLPPPGVDFLAGREFEIWADAWSTPQAAAWSTQKWRIPIIAEYVRLKALCEVSPNAALIAQIHRYRDQIGLTPAGLKENGWAIAADEVAAKAASRAKPAGPAPRRLRAAVNHGGE